MKIVHWDEMFHPNFGYQINVLPVYQKMDGHDVTIITSEHPEKHPVFASFSNPNDDITELDRRFSNETGVKIIRLPIYGVYSGRVIYKRGYISAINTERPDVIMCHTSDTLSSIQIIRHNKKLCAPIVFDNHMLEMASSNKLRNAFRLYYKTFVTPIIKKNRYITIRTQDDDYVIRCLGVPSELAPYISFGTDTELFKPDESLKNEMRSKYDIPSDAFVIIYAGKMDKNKGGQLLADAIKCKFETHKDVCVIIIGNILDDEYGEAVRHTLAISENRIIRINTQPYRELHRYYAMSDLAVFPKQCSLSFFDVQSSELPVVLENNNVNCERVSYDNGLVYEMDDISSFRSMIEKYINMDPEEYNKIKKNCRNHILTRYDYRKISKQYTDILYKEMLRQNENIKRSGRNEKW